MLKDLKYLDPIKFAHHIQSKSRIGNKYHDKSKNNSYR